jgi:hypothetical protein
VLVGASSRLTPSPGVQRRLRPRLRHPPVQRRARLQALRPRDCRQGAGPAAGGSDVPQGLAENLQVFHRGHRRHRQRREPVRLRPGEPPASLRSAFSL